MIDTHVLIWMAISPDKLGPQTVDAIETATSAGQVYVAAITPWEIATFAGKGRIKFNVAPADWIRGALSRPGIMIAELGVDVAIDAGLLPSGIHGDPGDRIIIATARSIGCPLVTADRKILDYAAAGHVRAIDARR